MTTQVDNYNYRITFLCLIREMENELGNRVGCGNPVPPLERRLRERRVNDKWRTGRGRGWDSGVVGRTVRRAGRGGASWEWSARPGREDPRRLEWTS